LAICIKFLPNVACQKMLKLASVLWSYSKIIVAHFNGPRFIEGNIVIKFFICQRQKQRLFNSCI